MNTDTPRMQEAWDKSSRTADGFYSSQTPTSECATSCYDEGRKLERELAHAIRERDEWKAKFIQQNKDLGCEQMDPNGTIWDYAKKVQSEILTVTKERDEPLFTIAEIADYVAGWHLSTESGALANALNQLHDDQDGILAVRERKQSLENDKEHAPLSARASVDHGVEVETKGEHENRAADRGCCVSSCSASSIPCSVGFYFVSNPEGSVLIMEAAIIDGELHLLRAGRSMSLPIGEYLGCAFIGPIAMPPRDHFARIGLEASRRSESQETSKPDQR